MSTSPWGKTENMMTNLADIMSEQYAHYLNDKQSQRLANNLNTLYTGKCGQDNTDVREFVKSHESNDADVMTPNSYSKNLRISKKQARDDESESDAVIAEVLQSQFDHQYNKELRRIEQHRNKGSKVTVSLDKYCRNGDIEFLDDTNTDDYVEDGFKHLKRDWDRFETNEKKLDAIPKCGFKLDEEGAMITKHDAQLCGVRNASRVMLFPPEIRTGDGAGFEMKLSNQVFNQIKKYSRRGSADKKSKMHNRKENLATAEMGVDSPTRLLLYKLINNKLLEQVNGIISTGKEAIILHAYSDPDYVCVNDPYPIDANISSQRLLPKECAIKIFKTTLNEFKQRNRYIKDDFRFKERFCKQNNRHIIHLWAEKEMHNLIRMKKVGLNVPSVVLLKKNILIISFIGDNLNAAPKLKDSILSDSHLNLAYSEIVFFMRKLYKEAKLVHADLSEYNVLWYEEKCWFIDVAQSVTLEHSSALEFLMRDCENVIKFFVKRGLHNIYTKEQLFEYVSGLNTETYNVAMLESIHTRGTSTKRATALNQFKCPENIKSIEYPFNLAWNKSRDERHLNMAEKEFKSNSIK